MIQWTPSLPPSDKEVKLDKYKVHVLVYLSLIAYSTPAHTLCDGFCIYSRAFLYPFTICRCV